MKKTKLCIVAMLCLFHYAQAQQWNQTAVPGNPPFTSLAFDGARLFATANNFGSTMGGVFSKSTLSGTSWDMNINTNLDLYTGLTKNAFVAKGGYLFVGTGAGGRSPAGLLRSKDVTMIDWGGSVSHNNTPPVSSHTNFTSFVADTSTHSSHYDVFAGTRGGENGIFKSEDLGTTWESYNSGIKAYSSLLDVNALTSLGKDVYAATDSGVIKLTDGYGSWTVIGMQGKRILSIAISSTDLFVGTDGYGVYHAAVPTGNGAWNFTAVNNGLPPMNCIVNALLIDGANVYAGINGNGLLYMASGSTWSWVTFNKGLTTSCQVSAVTSLAKQGSYFFAGTNAGVWSYY